MTELAALEARFHAEKVDVRTLEDFHRFKAAYLGKKGHITALLRQLGDLPPEARPAFGSAVNQVKNRLEEECEKLAEAIAARKKAAEIRSEAVDVTLPGRYIPSGGLHPVTQVLEEVEDIFREVGFDVFEGSEIETDFYNFEALNMPTDHPAREMQDTFYLKIPGHLLRTHTSPVQVHVMKSQKPPIRMIAPGVVYRRDFDVSHTPMFHQVEGLVVEDGIQFSHLKGIVSWFLHRFFGESLRVRFRPSFFPFTEPSAEVDIQCVLCRGSGKTKGEGGREDCRLCRQSGWLEVMGCGMVHPAVFEKSGYDSRKYRGFAFGMGIERLTMLRRRIPDLRMFFENDLRFLTQF